MVIHSSPPQRAEQNFRSRKNSHLANKAILIHRPALLPPSQPRRLRPHLLHILQHHIAVSIEGLDARQQLAVVAARDQDLGVRAHGCLEDGQRTAGELVLLEGCDFEFASGGEDELVGGLFGRWGLGVRGLMGLYVYVQVYTLDDSLRRNVREVVAWLCQQFSGSFVSIAGVIWVGDILDLGCVGHCVICLGIW